MAGKSMKPGGGGRFAKLKKQLGEDKSINDPGALAASIGRKKYGGKTMARFGRAGRVRAAKQ